MNWLTVVSAFAVLAAAVPSLYFAVRLRRTKPKAAGLALLLALTFLIHAGFHFSDVLGAPTEAVSAAEAVSAGLTFLFALAYWPLRRRS